MVLIKEWFVVLSGDNFDAPEVRKPRLGGLVYGHKNFEDGTFVLTSPILSVENMKTHKIVKTVNTEYSVYSKDVSPKYESAFPGAYRRLSFEVYKEGVEDGSVGDGSTADSDEH